jgi:uncharacterized membrane protein HdeD (DUF308 family)
MTAASPAFAATRTVGAARAHGALHEPAEPIQLGGNMSQLARNWWILALNGVIAIILGAIAFLMPGVTLAAMVILFGAFSFADGITRLVAGIRAREREKRWWAMILQAVFSIGAGLITVFVPLATAFGLLLLVAAWAIVTGAFEIAAAIRLRREIEGEWLLLVSGILSVVFGVLVAVWPGASLVAMAWMVGAYLIASGTVMLAVALRLRGRARPPIGELRPRPAGI